MLKPLNRQTVPDFETYPERIVQFGGGNFLRAFLDWVIQILNDETEFNSGVVVVKATAGTYDDLDNQDRLFHTYLRGLQGGTLIEESKLISCVNRTMYPYDDFETYLELARQPEIRFIFSNTTEAGISFVGSDKLTDRPPSSFPAKLTAFLHERHQHFHGAEDKSCIIIPTELIVDNGTRLHEIVLQFAELWGLETGFAEWIESHNLFCNTLVDRIVTGFPQEEHEGIYHELDYEDKLLVAGEIYHSWIVEAPQSLLNELPIHKTQTSLNIKIVESASAHRTIKVRLLNGAHTSIVPIGYLLGLKTVRDCVEHPNLGKFLRDLLYDDIIPSIDNIDKHELETFAADVLDRFRNPHIHHLLKAIALNSISKYRERLLPSLIGYYANIGELPHRIVLALSALIRFYYGIWQGEAIPLNDDIEIMTWFKNTWASAGSVEDVVVAVLENESLWGQDLSTIDGLVDKVTEHLLAINDNRLEEVIHMLNEASDDNL